MKRNKYVVKSRAGSREGMALVTSLVILFILSGIAVAALATSMAQQSEVSSSSRESRSFYMAEAGLNESLFVLTAAMNSGQPAPAAVGSAANPIEVQNGSYWCDIVDNGDTTFTVTSSGRSNFKQTTVQAIVERPALDPFDHAVFAGNDGGDPNYTMTFGGNGAQGDDITGNIYSGGNVDLTGSATIAGDVEAQGTITGVGGTEGVTHPTPDIPGMNYAVNNDVDVAALFATATQQSNSHGGTAWELPATNPAHIFRKNPDDRLVEINGTTKDDYFLEDPHEAVFDFNGPSGNQDGHTITLSADGTEKVYYIDGNLWVHNRNTLGIRFTHQGPGHVRLTFVVSGNIYFSDDVFTANRDQDALAFIAIEDATEADSGNIYLGDPRFGTLEAMEAFMYAENNFYDVNLDEHGSSTVHIKGNMTAGNQVAIERDFIDGATRIHSKLTVEFDDRISTGAVPLPGLPRVNLANAGYRVAFWRKLENQAP